MLGDFSTLEERASVLRRLEVRWGCSASPRLCPGLGSRGSRGGPGSARPIGSRDGRRATPCHAVPLAEGSRVTHLWTVFPFVFRDRTHHR